MRMEKQWICQTCSARFKSSAALSRHKKQHTAEPKFKCGVCQTGFNRKDNFLRHEEACHRKANKPPPVFSCQKCGRVFKTKQNMERHMKICKFGETNNNEDRPCFPCNEPGCRKTYSSQANLTKHIRSKHASAEANPQNQNDESSIEDYDKQSGENVAMDSGDELPTMVDIDFNTDRSFTGDLSDPSLLGRYMALDNMGARYVLI